MPACLLALGLTCTPLTAVAQRATAVRFERLAQEHGLGGGLDRLGLQPANGSTERLLLGFTEDAVVKLRHDENAFSIVFRSLDYSEPRIVYSYRNGGMDRSWVNGGNRGAATYTCVPPGGYA